MATEVQTKEEELREKLGALLQKDDIDYGEVVKLSKELAKQDPDNVRFSTDAAIIDKLGRELVSRQETAVAELIKNGYDADATQVELIFKNAEDPGGTLVVEDDGHGMTRQQLIDGFMRLSSRDKVREPVSPKYERQRVGEKGIGRFATQRLGQQLVITTQTEDSPYALQVTINWREFEGGRDLEEITNEIQDIPEGRSRGHGTTLQIQDLRDGWTEATMQRVYRYVSDLIQPFPLSKESETRKIDPGFKVSVFCKGEEDYESVADEKQLVYDNALAEINARVDENGNGFWKVESSKLGIEEEEHKIGRERDTPGEPFQKLRSVQFRAYYFIYNKSLIPKLARKKIRELAENRGGIRLYRNGFRVLPYGEPGNDWVGLDQSTRARKILPPHANNNFFGFVEIIDPEGEQFEEKSSREGLLHNLAFDELQDFVYRSIRGAVLRVAEERDKKGTAGDEQTDEDKSASEGLRDTAERLSEAAEEADEESDPEEATKKLKEAVERESERAEERAEVEEEREAARIQEKEMLRVLASLGTAVAEFTHELRSPLASARTNANNLFNALPEESEEKGSARDLRDNVDDFQAYASYFDETVSENTQRELESVDLIGDIEDFVEAARPLAPDVEIEVEYESYSLQTVPMHPSEWSSILFNFFSNARKAIRRESSAGAILIRAGQNDDTVFVEFADDGDGIDEGVRDRIFDPFYTTTGPPPRQATEAEELRGSGLGLSIVNDIVTGYDGDVYLVTPPEGYSTCFRVDIPASENN